MKFSIFIIMAVLFLSCKKDDDANNSRWGTASALLNGEYWEGEISASDNNFQSDTGIIIKISSVNEAGFDVDYFDFFKVPVIVDRYPLSLTNVEAKDSLIGSEYITLLSDGHVFGDIYRVLEGDSTEDYIEITEISGNEIKGSFQVSFLRDTIRFKTSPSTPDTVVFTNGQFHTRLRN